MEQYLSRRNIIIGSIISLIIAGLTYSFIKNRNLQYELEDESSLNKSPINQNDDYDESIISNFSEELKKATKNIYKLNSRSSETPEQISIKNNLFRKEINVKRIIIDSKEIHNLNNYNTSNYTIDLINKNGLNKGTIGRITNIINFKLIQCIIPTPPWNVTNNNYKIIINYNGTDTTISLTKDKLYTNDELATELKSKLTPLNASFNVTYTSSKFTISVTSPAVFYFKWNTNYDINKSYAYKLFGFEMKDYSSSSSVTSDNIPDSTQYHIDLVIPQLPPKNTIASLNNRNTLERIPLNKTGDLDMVVYDNINMTPYSHFFPISLDEITIQLYDTNGTGLYECGNKDNTFVFEYVELLNTSLMDKIKI